MPKILIIKSFIFVIYSVDVAESRYHIHVEAKKGRFRVSAKFWLSPEIEIVSKGDFSDKEINVIIKYIEKYRNVIIQQIEKFIKGEKIRCIKK
jgi:hypothetical protein